MTSKKLLLSLAKSALRDIQPQKLVRTAVQKRGNVLIVQGQRYDLRTYKNIYVVGAGKATLGMAKELQRILGKRITAGYINVPCSAKNIGNIIVNQASHPVPNAAGVRGAKQILQLAKQATANDLVICLISGGASSLLPLPIPGVTLAQKIAITKKLLRSGATINEINAVRKQLSAIKGGKLALAAQPATVISLIISDVIGDSLDIIGSGPTIPPLGGQGACVHNFLIGSNQQALQSIQKHAQQLGLKSHILTTQLHGEAREVSKVLLSIAREIKLHHRPMKPPVLLLAGGETTVMVTGTGFGGRNQELVLAALPELIPGITMMSLATDGVDGYTPRPVAGAMLAGEDKKIAVQEYLRDNNAYSALKKMKALWQPGATGTNVGDIIFILVK